MSEPKTIGIIGGMGPAATIDLFAKLVAATPAKSDQEHFRVLIDNNPRIPDRNLALAGKGPSPAPHLAEGARTLERAGADVIVIACNTAHAYAADMAAAVQIPILSMIDATVDAARAAGASRVGVLAGDGCLRAALYQDAFAAQNIEVLLLPEEIQRMFMELLYRIKGGDFDEGVSVGVVEMANSLVDRGADAIIAACTEVPLVLSADALAVALISSTDELVSRVIAFAQRN